MEMIFHTQMELLPLLLIRKPTIWTISTRKIIGKKKWPALNQATGIRNIIGNKKPMICLESRKTN